MNRKEKAYAAEYVILLASSIDCKDLTHPKKHQHSDSELCKAEYHRDRQVYILREIIKEYFNNLKEKG